MKKQTLAVVFSGLVSAGLAVVPMASFADASTKTEAAKTYVKDSVITTKVKAKLAADHPSTITNLDVKTDDNGTVYLSGTAPNASAADNAVATAMSVDGVKGVKSEILVKP